MSTTTEYRFRVILSGPFSDPITDTQLLDATDELGSVGCNDCSIGVRGRGLELDTIEPVRRSRRPSPPPSATWNVPVTWSNQSRGTGMPHFTYFPSHRVEEPKPSGARDDPREDHAELARSENPERTSGLARPLRNDRWHVRESEPMEPRIDTRKPWFELENPFTIPSFPGPNGPSGHRA